MLSDVGVWKWAAPPPCPLTFKFLTDEDLWSDPQWIAFNDIPALKKAVLCGPRPKPGEPSFAGSLLAAAQENVRERERGEIRSTYLGGLPGGPDITVTYVQFCMYGLMDEDARTRMELLSVSDAAECLGVSPQMVRRHCRAGSLSAARTRDRNRSWLIQPTSVADLIIRRRK